MPRNVKSMDLAMERLLALMPNAEPKTRGSKAKRLAFLADLAMHAGVQAEQVGWIGNVPNRGLAGWEDFALRWLKL